MFPYLQNISSLKKPLGAEATSSVLQVKNNSNNKNNVGSNEKNHKESYSDTINNDDNIFSVNSLIYFLEDLLECRLSSKLNNDSSQNLSSFKPWVKTNHSNINEKPFTPPKKAAIAYAHGAEAIQDNHTQAPSSKNQHNETMNDVYHLLRDLRDLRDEGVNRIKLDKNGTFIDSIENAVQIAKIELN